MASPFDYVKSINSGKENMMRNTENDKLAEKNYNPWLTNLAFALYPDTILYANEMNLRPYLDKRPQYEFYLNAVRPRMRKGKWVKHEDDDDLNAICRVYECNKNVGKQYLELLTEEQLKEIHKSLDVGGIIK